MFWQKWQYPDFTEGPAIAAHACGRSTNGLQLAYAL
ncbi:hypothetical protein MASSI9I_100029 [Massilia sp. 9I]|nr:hypothetical protein MASSI9I_100029 [Massilia sp. 9I]